MTTEWLDQVAQQAVGPAHRFDPASMIRRLSSGDSAPRGPGVRVTFRHRKRVCHHVEGHAAVGVAKPASDGAGVDLGADTSVNAHAPGCRAAVLAESGLLPSRRFKALCHKVTANAFRLAVRTSSGRRGADGGYPVRAARPAGGVGGWLPGAGTRP